MSGERRRGAAAGVGGGGAGQGGCCSGKQRRQDHRPPPNHHKPLLPSVTAYVPSFMLIVDGKYWISPRKTALRPLHMTGTVWPG